MSKRVGLGYAAGQAVDAALMELADIEKAVLRLKNKQASREETLIYVLEAVLHIKAAERALRDAKAPKPE